eukprot:133005-Rhodomonas_salina.1
MDNEQVNDADEVLGNEVVDVILCEVSVLMREVVDLMDAVSQQRQISPQRKMSLITRVVNNYAVKFRYANISDVIYDVLERGCGGRRGNEA